MLSKLELKELAAYRSETSSVLSVYLNVDPTQRTTEQYRLTLRGMLKSVADRASRQSIEAVENYIDLEYDRQGKEVVIFCAKDFWRTYAFAIPVGDYVFVSPQPYIKPLADFFDAYDRYGVVLIDREGARLFIFDQGTLLETTGMLGEEIKGQIRGASGRGGRSGAGTRLGMTSGLDRKIDQIAMRNLREIVDLTQEFYRAGRCERIILGGTAENRARFMSMLPKTLQSKVIGGLAIDMYASEGTVWERSVDIIQQSVAERKDALTKNLMTAVRTGKGSLGLSDTLHAVQEGRVQTLVISEGVRAHGHMCSHCSYLTLTETDTCPVCQGATRKVEDIVDQLVHRAIGSDVKVVFVHDEAMEQVNSIGALWRF